MHALSCAAAALALGLFSQGAAATCYVIHDKAGEVVYRSFTPPVDLSRPLHQTLPQTAPGGRLVFAPDGYGCESPVDRLGLLPKPVAASGSADLSPALKLAPSGPQLRHE